MLDSYNQIWNRVMLRCPAASSLLARDWVTNAFRQVAERRRWSWLIKFGQFVAPPLVNSGRVNVTTGSSEIIGVGTDWDPTMVGRQFRVGTPNPISTISQVNSPTSLNIDITYGGSTANDQPYEIYQAYFTPPSDFHAFIVLWDPRMNWRLWLNIQQDELNTWDAMRANRGQSYVVASLDYSRDFVGTVSTVKQVHGSGPGPVRTDDAIYTAPASAVFSIEVTASGVNGVAQYQWKKNDGAYTTGVFTDSYPQDLQDGVQIFWPDNQFYEAGNVFVIVATPFSRPGIPRYEIWPHMVGPYVYPYFYESRATDLADPGAVLPRYIRGDSLLELALAEAARWPGPATDRPNPYFNPNLALMHANRAEKFLLEMERQDDEVYEQDITFQQTLGFPMATPFGDSAWLQRVAI